MKLTLILLTTSLLTARATGFSQSLSFSGKNVQLEKVFNEIRKQTGYHIIYNSGILAGTKPVTINAENMLLIDFMQMLLNDQPITFKIVSRTILLMRKTSIAERSLPVNGNTDIYATPISVSGIVRGANGQPLEGATIKVKETNKSVISDPKGNFTISIEGGQTLIFSYTGYKEKEITIQKAVNNLILSLQLSDSNLDEIIVTAYGIERSAKEVGYSVEKVTSEQINQANPGNLLTILAGRVSGLAMSNLSADMDRDKRVLLRGIRSISRTTNNLPLFIINGSPLSFGNDNTSAGLVLDFINNINPIDIHEITVIKGANGAALYGPEGINGVILITTKKGAKGQPSVSFRNNTSFQSLDFRQVITQKQFGSGNGDLDANGNGIYDPATIFSWGPAFNGQSINIGKPDEIGDIQNVPYSYSNERRKFWNTAVQAQNNLSISQSDGRSDFYLGLNYAVQSGIRPRDKQHRTGIVFNAGREMGKLRVRLNMAYTRKNDERGPVIHTESIPAHVPVTRYHDYLNDHWSDRNHYWSDQIENPYEKIDRIRNNETQNVVYGNIDFILKPLKWLTITERPGINYSGSFSKKTTGPLQYSDFAKMHNRYKDRPASVNEAMVTNTSVNNDLLIQAVNGIGDFVLRTTVGNTIRENYIKQMGAQSGNLLIPVYNVSFSSNSPYGLEESQLSRFYSFFGSAALGYKNRIFIELTARNDRDSKLAAVARNKNFYYGANASAVLTDIFPSLPENNKWLTSVRLRASVTSTANMNIVPYQSERIVENSGYRGILSYSINTFQFPNALLEPEKIISQEFGSSFSFLKDRLSLDVTYYRQVNKGLILDVVNANMSGAPTVDNAGRFLNYGWEFNVKMTPVVKKASSPGISFNSYFAINNNRVLELSPVYNDELMVANAGRWALIARKDYHSYEYKVYDWMRDADGRVIVDRQTGWPEMNYDSAIHIGRSLPKYTAGLGLNFEWKRWTLGILAEYRGGNSQAFDGAAYMLRNGTHPITSTNNRNPYVFPNSVYYDNNNKLVQNADVMITPDIQFYTHLSNAGVPLIINAAFFKLREIVLRYELPVKRKFLKGVNASIYTRDILSIYAKSNLFGDPENIQGPRFESIAPQNQNNIVGSFADQQRFPGTILYGFTINLIF